MFPSPEECWGHSARDIQSHGISKCRTLGDRDSLVMSCHRSNELNNIVARNSDGVYEGVAIGPGLKAFRCLQVVWLTLYHYRTSAVRLLAYG